MVWSGAAGGGDSNTIAKAMAVANPANVKPRHRPRFAQSDAVAAAGLALPWMRARIFGHTLAGGGTGVMLSANGSNRASHALTASVTPRSTPIRRAKRVRARDDIVPSTYWAARASARSGEL